MPTRPTQRLIDQVQTFTLDVAVVAEPNEGDVFLATPPYLEELLIVVPSGHDKVESSDDLYAESLIIFEEGYTFRRYAER